MDLTDGYMDVIPEAIRKKYDIYETRSAARVIQATNPDEWNDILSVLDWFVLTDDDVTKAGGSKSDTAARLDTRFRDLGWREGRYDTHIRSVIRRMPYRPAGEKKAVEGETEVTNEGYKVDNVKGGRVAVDVEWNAKDGNLDRDLGMYRGLHDAGVLDAAVIITRHHESTKQLSADRGSEMFKTTTTTNIEKLVPRLTRGDGAGCPVLAIAITDRCWTAPSD